MEKESIKISTKVLGFDEVITRKVSELCLGDQAEIVFSLIGEPPFTFTYQRAEPSPKKGGKPGRVLETHTVSRVYTKEYSVYSALEGEFFFLSLAHVGILTTVHQVLGQ